MTVSKRVSGLLTAALLVLLWPAGTALAAPGPSPSPSASPSPTPASTPSPTARPLMGPRATLVAFSTRDPWTAQVSGFDLDRVESVTYFVRDAGGRWHSVGPITDAPFTADLDWWAWNDAGQMVVTSHVQMQAGGVVIRDPGGWTAIDGRSVDPGGSLEAMANSDGSLGASYTPARDAPLIAAVQFWLRIGGQWNRVAEVAHPDTSGSFAVSSIPGTDSGGWKADDTAMSVHVVWPDGRQWVDPVPWAWRDHFVAAPAADATPTGTPAPTPTAAPQATATPTAAPRAAPPPPPTAAPAPPPPPPAPAGCYPKTNSGGCYQPGEFCRATDHGASGRTASGEAIVCVDNDGWRWEPA